MHVMLLPSWYPTESDSLNGVFFREQAVSLRKYGLTVGVLSLSVVSIRYPKNILKALKTRMTYSEEYGVHTYRKTILNWSFRNLRLYRFFYILAGRKLFKAYVKKYGVPDLIHVHSMLDAGILAKYFNDKFKIPYVVTEHSSSFLRNTYDHRKILLLEEIAENSSRNIAVSNFLANKMKKITNVNNWETVPNIANELFFLKKYKRSHKKDVEFRFLTVCALNKNKHIDLLIRAFSKVIKNNPRVKLIIGGNGDEYDNLTLLASNLNVMTQVSFLGSLSRKKVLSEMNNANVFISTSNYETFGIVLVEALAQGLPVIATRSGGPEDIVEEFNGFLIPTDDESALVNAMERMINQYNSFNKTLIQQKANEKFSERVIINKLKLIYYDVLK